MKIRTLLMSQNWHTMRWVALSIGIFLGFMAYQHNDILTAGFSAFFLFQAITNKGCMVSQSCISPIDSAEKRDDSSATEYTEVL